MVGCSSNGAAESAIRRLWITITHEGFEGVGCALKGLASEFRSTSLSPQCHCASKQGKTVLGKICFDGCAKRRSVLRQYAILAHQRPSCTAIEEAPENTVNCSGRQEGA
ncbi:Uncharacterised protein [Enterobacter cloacae]|nr:Uncharacterised protein [Enterobacter cloacae]